MQYYGIVTLLPNSKYSSPIFAQRKPSGRLRILIGLRRVNHLLRNDYSDKISDIEYDGYCSSLRGENIIHKA